MIMIMLTMIIIEEEHLHPCYQKQRLQFPFTKKVLSLNFQPSQQKSLNWPEIEIKIVLRQRADRSNRDSTSEFQLVLETNKNRACRKINQPSLQLLEFRSKQGQALCRSQIRFTFPNSVLILFFKETTNMKFR